MSESKNTSSDQGDNMIKIALEAILLALCAGFVMEISKGE